MLSNEEIKRLRKYNSAKGRLEFGLFMAEGEKLVAELMAAKYHVKSVYYINGHLPPNMAKGIDSKEISLAEMARITQLNNPSPIAAIAQLPPKEELIKGDKIVYLDTIADPGNAGTIIRSCHWFGIDTILMSENSVDRWNTKLIQASMGSVFKINIIENVQTDMIKKLVNDGFHLTSTYLNGSDIKKWKPKQKQMIVFGSEAHGISLEINALCHNQIKILGSGAESLNVAAAAAIVLFDWNNKLEEL